MHAARHADRGILNRMNGTSQHVLNALAGSMAFWVALILLALALYVLPSVIAAVRGVGGLGWIIVINVLPTGVGWPAALLLALALPGRPRMPRPARPVPAQPPAADRPDAPSARKVISGARYHVID
jgi:hypothetical protein